MLELRNISKSFGSTRALNAVDLTVPGGTVVGLLGQNGSGKSTLVRILAGYHSPEHGAEARVDGRPVDFPLARTALGLACVFQDLGLATQLTVLENLTVGQWVGRSAGGRLHIDWRAERRRAQAVLERYAVPLPLDARVAELSLKDQALLAIVRSAEEVRRFRAVGHGGDGILVLDEPTVFLSNREKTFLLDLVRRIAAGGAGVLIVSHDLPVILEVADRATVLRNGVAAGEVEVSRTSEEALAMLVIGGSSSPQEAVSVAGNAAPAVPMQATEPLVARGLRGGRVRGIDLRLGPGEIVGLAGLLGSGAEDVPGLLFGLVRGAEGSVKVESSHRLLGRMGPRDAIALGLGYVPPDRKRDGLVALLTVQENLLLLVADRYYHGGWFRRRRARADARRLSDAFRVHPREVDVPLGSLSGGNQQKVLLAKWCEIGPRVLILHEPSQGVDVGARAEIYRIVRERAAAGTAVLWVTTDFAEMATVCDRVAVVHKGRLTGELSGPQVAQETISRAVLTWGDAGDAAGG